MSKRDEQIARMKGLMTYGISNTSKKTPVTESVEGADGKVYAIIREGAKFYIKSTQKGSELVTESFDYIGGFMNKKNNEYSSYNQASKNLELKLRSINEAYGINKPVELLNPDKKEELVCEMTDSMKATLARYRQIMNNAAGIMKENQTISMSNTGNPEAPKTTSFNSKLGEPFTETGKAELDKDLKATSNEQEKEGAPFGDTSKTEEYKDAKFVPKGSVANQKPTGGKVVRVNESDSLSDDLDSYDYEETMEDLEESNFFHNPNFKDDEQLPELPDEITIDEDAESYVGFADDDNSMDEDIDEEDIDLDDIDIDLDTEDSNVEDEVELDDFDSDDDTEDDFDSDEDEIQALKDEIEKLKDMINDLSSEQDDDEENEYELEIDDDDDNSDEDFENETLSESVKLPFDVKYRTDEMKNPKSRFYRLCDKLSQMKEELGGNENDEELLAFVRKTCVKVIKCEYELIACQKNNFTDDETWYEILMSLLDFNTTIFETLKKFSFINKQNINEVYNIFVLFRNSFDRWYDYYLEYIDTDEDSLKVDNDDEYDDIEDEDNNQYDDEQWDTEYDDSIFDSISPRKINEDKLNVFGKHPSYRKKPMTLPKTGSDENDWNDESVYSEEPFGTKKGSNSPYDNIVDIKVKSILENLKKKI